MEKWYTFSQASKLIGKNRNYFSNRYRLNPEYFEKHIQFIGGIKFINDDGIKYILSQQQEMVEYLKKYINQVKYMMK